MSMEVIRNQGHQWTAYC